jgi:hypothetical protein
MPPVTTSDLLLPEGTRLLHLGPPKTGTTGIQLALHRRREVLREHGVVYPGKGTRPREPIWAVLGHPSPDNRPAPRIERWHALCREVEEAGDLRVCISDESLGKAELDGAMAVVEGLGGPRAHIVAAARRLDTLLPSQWQQRVKMRAISLSWEDWLEIVLNDNPDHPVWRNIWVPHGIGGLVERWVKATGDPDRFTLVVADESDRTLLPRTFEQMLGLPEGLLIDAATDVRNPSLSYGRIEAIRKLNRAFDEHDWPDDPSLRLRIRATDQLKTGTPWPEEQKIPPLPPWAAERVAELNAQRAELVRHLGVRVIGDPDNLLGSPPTGAAVAPGPIMVSAELAGHAVAEVIDEAVNRSRVQQAAYERRLRRLERKLHKAEKAAARARARAQKKAGGRPAAKAKRATGPSVDQLTARQLVGVLRQRAVRRLTRR